MKGKEVGYLSGGKGNRRKTDRHMQTAQDLKMEFSRDRNSEEDSS